MFAMEAVEDLIKNKIFKNKPLYDQIQPSPRNLPAFSQKKARTTRKVWTNGGNKKIRLA